MKEFDVAVIGGSAAGLTAAITAKRFYPEKTVLMVRKEKNVLIPCGIPYIYGTIGAIEKNLIPDEVLEKNGVELMVGEVTEINKSDKMLKTSGDSVKYDKLIIATGSDPVAPPIKGVDKKGVFMVKKEEDYLSKLLEEVNQSKDIIIIGGGFIGMEFADECKKNRDINISVIEALPHCLMLVFDEEFCKQALALKIERLF